MLDGIPEVIQVAFMTELRVMVANDQKALIHGFIVPIPQRGHHPLAVDSAKCPHLQ